GKAEQLAGPNSPEPEARSRARSAAARPGARGVGDHRDASVPMSGAAGGRSDGDAARGVLRAGQPAADAAAPTPEHVLAGAGLIREGRMFRLARERFPKMPLWPGHPTFEVVSYRTPHGSRVTEDHHWGLPNDACLGFMSEL